MFIIYLKVNSKKNIWLRFDITLTDEARGTNNNVMLFSNEEHVIWSLSCFGTELYNYKVIYCNAI